MAVSNGLNITTPNSVVITDSFGAPMAGLALPAGVTLNGSTISTSADGTFTPTFSLGGLSTGVTYSSQLGFYTVLTGVYFFSLYIALTNKGIGTGPALIEGLPIAARDVNFAYLVNNLTIGDGLALPGGLQITTTNLGTTALLTGDSVTGNTPIVDTNITNTSTFSASGFILI